MVLGSNAKECCLPAAKFSNPDMSLPSGWSIHCFDPRLRLPSSETSVFVFHLTPTDRIFWAPCVRCGCNFYQMALFRWRAFYRGTRLPATVFHSTDLQRSFWQQPPCHPCIVQWVLKNHDQVYRKLATPTVILQRWVRKCLYSPPCARWPQGGRAFRRAATHFYGTDHPPTATGVADASPPTGALDDSTCS